ncbi:hypothetical protein, partial [Ruminococcus champanellensis]|uniref:hypothetical protein n=1 Tax=Ruminococcus champanellensis TaxID=1161942 RepID=UPI0026DD390C
MGAASFGGHLFCLFFMLWVLHLRFADLLFQLPFPFALLFMLCVLGTRNTGLPDAWGDNPGEGGQPGCN